MVQGTTRTFVVPADIDGDGQIASTFTSVLEGPSGLQTLTQTTEVPVGSYIASLGGISDVPEPTATATVTVSSGGSSGNSSSPIEFENGANLPHRSLVLALTTVLLLLMINW